MLFLFPVLVLTIFNEGAYLI